MFFSINVGCYRRFRPSAYASTRLRGEERRFLLLICLASWFKGLHIKKKRQKFQRKFLSFVIIWLKFACNTRLLNVSAPFYLFFFLKICFLNKIKLRTIKKAKTIMYAKIGWVGARLSLAINKSGKPKTIAGKFW